jgi:hypothetical protein
MTVFTIELPDDQQAALVAKAQAKGLSAELYAEQVLERDLAPRLPPPGRRGMWPGCNRGHDPGRS